MPVTVDDFLWEATGFSPSGTSVVVTHPDAGGTTAGSTVLVFIYATTTISAAPAGWANLGPVTTTFAYTKIVGAGETTWTWTISPGTAAAWYMVELTNIAIDPYDGHNSGTSTISNGGTRSTGTTALNAGSSGLALAMFGCVKAAGGDVQSWSGYTNSFTERVDVGPAGVAGKQIAVAYKLYEGWATQETTATFATTAASASTSGLIVLLRSADASINAPLAFHTGFEFGTHGGMGQNTINPLGALNGASGTFGTSYQVTSGAARNGGYGLDVTATAGIAYVPLPGLVGGTFAFGCNIKPVSGTGTPEALIFDTAGTDLLMLYDVTAEKFGLQWSTGSVVWQTGTTPLGTWAWVDIRGQMNSSVQHADWAIETGTGDGTQTPPTDITGATPAVQIDFRLGNRTSGTFRYNYDDPVYTRYSGAYPLRPHVVRLLVPETTGASISGTSSNFSKFTANGTLAAWASDAGSLLDEVPPTVSASSDGVVQTAVAASDYAQFPMTSYTLTSDEIIAGVRFLASEWGGTGTGTGTLGWFGWDGTAETTFQAVSASYDADSLTAISATYPRWVTAMWNPGTAWTPTQLNNVAVRMGRSTDATPDMGASAIYLEVATRSTNTVRTLSLEDDDIFTVDLIVNPYNSATVSYVITNSDPVRDCTFSYSLSGTPQTPIVVAALDSQIVDIHAAAFGDVSDITLIPDT